MDYTILNKQIARLEKFDTDLTISRVVKKENELIIDMNFDDQLYDKGVFPDGKPTGDYSPTTLKFKEAPGSHDHKTDHITFKDEGDFYKGAFIKTNKKSFKIDSRDSKRDELVAREGDMFGLTKENLTELGKVYILPELQKDAKKAV